MAEKKNDFEEKNVVPIKPIKKENIYLNVGGMKFKTTNITLSKSAYFRGLLSSKHSDGVQSDNNYLFVDRNGKYFEYLLDYMRYGYVSIPSKYAEMIHLEAKFYQIKLDLSDHIRKQKMPQSIIIWRYSHTSKMQELRVNGNNLCDTYHKYEITQSEWNRMKEHHWAEFQEFLVTYYEYEVTAERVILDVIVLVTINMM